MKFSFRSFLVVSLGLNFVNADPFKHDVVKLERYSKRAVCIPEAANNVTVDTTPSIRAAIEKCGAGGTILIPENQTFNIHSRLDFSGCDHCDFQLEGTLNVTGDLDTWTNQDVIISMEGIKGAKFRSLTGKGIIEGNGITFYTRDRWNGPYCYFCGKRFPILHLVNGSSDVIIANITARNAFTTFFQVGGNSTNVTYTGLDLSLVGQYAVIEYTEGESRGLVTSNSTHVTVSGLTVDFRVDANNTANKVGNCVNIDFGTHDLAVSDVYCNSNVGVVMRAGSSGYYNLYDKDKSVSDVYISRLRADTGGPAAAFLNDNAQNATFTNITWDDVEIVSGSAVGLDFCYETPPISTPRCNIALTYAIEYLSDIWFKNFHGKIGGAGLSCSRFPSKCEFNFVNWTNATGSYNVTTG